LIYTLCMIIYYLFDITNNDKKYPERKWQVLTFFIKLNWKIVVVFQQLFNHYKLILIRSEINSNYQIVTTYIYLNSYIILEHSLYENTIFKGEMENTQ